MSDLCFQRIKNAFSQRVWLQIVLVLLVHACSSVILLKIILLSVNMPRIISTAYIDAVFFIIILMIIYSK